jgi:zinc D-Ala-D-Ala carboxypeptidase
MLPLQSISTLMGISTPINPKSVPVSVKNDRFSIELAPGSTIFIINGNEVDLGIEPAIINNTVYIPVDLIDIALKDILYYDRTKKEISTPAGSKKNVEDPVVSVPAGKPFKISYNVSNSSFMGNLVLVNKDTHISSSFVPANLSSVLDKNNRYVVPCKNSSVKLDKSALNAAAAMFNAAKASGIYNLIVSNGYRSYDLQSTLHTRKINAYKKIYRSKEAVEKASSIVAPPGMSEHQTGLAIDVTTRSMLNGSEALTENFAATPEGKWIYSNSWKYGYVVRYQKDKTKITGIVSEPWHIRYVGVPHAEYMYKNKLCLEEYLELIKNRGYIKFKANTGSEYEIFYINVSISIQTLSLTCSRDETYDISSYGKNGFIVTKKSIK